MRGVHMALMFGVSILIASNAAAVEDQDEARRVTRAVDDQIVIQSMIDSDNRALAQRRGRLHTTISVLVHSSEPDIERIRALIDEERALSVELDRVLSETRGKVLGGLSEKDYLTYLRSNVYTLPPAITAVQPSPSPGE